MAFLPVTAEEMRARGWEEPDFVYVTGDAYVDHPSFGLAIISRVLEAHGYRVAMLPQPDWHTCADFTRFGRPRLGFLVTAGVIDSMVNHYTAAKKPRSQDAYSPGGQAGHRPDRATIVYCNRIREAYGNVPIAIGGVEASLRRFAHYDYWDDRVRNSILVDSGADVLMFGMGERVILEVAQWLAEGQPVEKMRIPGTCVMAHAPEEGYIAIPSAEEVARDKQAYARAFLEQYRQQDPIIGKGLCQPHGNRYLLQNPPDKPLSTSELDAVYRLPFERAYHPMYEKDGGIPALEEVQFSIAATRGCFGACSFCALTFHQGRIVSARSRKSIVEEGKLLTHLPGFKGYIHDVGGPTANFRRPACEKQLQKGACPNRQCLFPQPCKNIRADHAEFVGILRELRALPGVKKVFIRSGIRYDYLLLDKSPAFLRELTEHHVSGQLKVAPEHVSANALSMMGKPGPQVFEEFRRRFEAENRRLGKKQYLVPYFMSSHPGCTLEDAIELALYLRRENMRPEQVQDFYPTPGTLSTAMYYTGLDPRTMQRVYVPRSPSEKAMQRALLQASRPENRALVLRALRQAGRMDLVGYGKGCLIAPEKRAAPDARFSQGKKPAKRAAHTRGAEKGQEKTSARGGKLSHQALSPDGKHFPARGRSNAGKGANQASRASKHRLAHDRKRD